MRPYLAKKSVHQTSSALMSFTEAPEYKYNSSEVNFSVETKANEQ